MPLLHQWKINSLSEIVVWKIKEDLSFFIEKLPDTLKTKATNKQKQVEFFTSRYLLKRLYPTFDFNRIDTTQKKPRSFQDGLFFSISHSFPFVSVILSKQNVGIDIQRIENKITELTDKFLNREEKIFFNHQDVLIATLLWSIKECVYKLVGESLFSYATQINIPAQILLINNYFQEIKVEYFNKTKSKKKTYLAYYVTLGDYVICYAEEIFSLDI